MRHIGMALAPFAAVALITGTADAQTPVAPAQGARSAAHRLLDVPYLPQTPELCGGAAVAMVMRYWGDRTVLPMDFRGLVTSSAGIVTADLVRAVTARGWAAVASEAPDSGAVAELQREVDRGRPVIALVESSPGRLHYMVVVGVTTDGHVVVHDPARTSFRVLAGDEFDRTWRASGHWQLIVLPPALGVGPTAPPAVVADLHRTRHGACGALVDGAVAIADVEPQAAEAALDAARELCPTDADPWLELAGLRFRAGQWRDAATLAEGAAALEPTDVDAWALIGTSRLMDDDERAALAAWNHIGEPSIDTVTITGARNTPQPALVRIMGLTPRTLLTPRTFSRASRRLADAPTADLTRLSFAPTGDGRATVSAAMVEREAFPHAPIELAGLAARAAVSDDVRLTMSGLFGQGETVEGAWRWPAARPRVGAMLSLPAPAPLGGVVTIDGFWERQSYSISAADAPASVVRDTRRRLTFNLGNWISGDTNMDAGGGIDRFGTTDYVSIHGALEQHAAGDRLVARADGELWRLGGDRGFSTESLSVTWTSTTDITRPTVATTAGYVSASPASPRALWMGAGTGQGRPLLLRAHPLLDDDIVRGPLFGRQIAFATSEYARPLMQRVFGMLSAAVFVDAAEVWHTLDGAARSPFEVDAGIGLRLRVSQTGGSARLDIGHGLRDGGTVLSAGWTGPAARLFSRGMPW